ncbi:MAG: SGNH/GDSL hydrolase family protein [Lachnospiraceae bacterium]|nr:SGNH/GDSL hydrolase family protein [Lachnospiraceae bacterium]
MKKKIGKILIVLLKTAMIILLVVTLNRIMMPKYINENKDGRITQEYYPFAKYSDVIFAGSSTVFSGIDPATLWQQHGISSFIRANASQTMWISYYMTEDAIKHHKPELVCLDMTFIKYDDDFVEEPSTRKALDGMRLSRSKIDCALASMGEDEKLMEYLVPLFRFHTRWMDFSWDDIRYAWYNKPVTVNGYIEDNETEPAEEDELVYTAQFDHISPKNEEYLRRCIKLCQDNGVAIMLFKTPAHSSNWSEELDDNINEIAKEYGITYINFDAYNDEMGMDYSTDTPDKGAHLNSSGAEKFTTYLGDLISSDYGVTDRRDDIKYEKRWSRITE